MVGGVRTCDGSDHLALFAVTHQHAPLRLLEQVSVPADDTAELRRRLLEFDGVDEVVVLSTCNRTELYLAGRAPDPAAALRVLAADRRVPVRSLQRSASMVRGLQVAEHLFRVIAGLESRIVGEAEIAGQVRAAFASAVKDGSAGPDLQGLFRFAAATARRVRSAVDGTLAPSLPQIALDTVASDAWSAAPIVILGSGTMARATARELSARGAEYLVCARRAERAAKIATRAEQIISFENLPSVLDASRLVFCATAARTPLLTEPDLRASSLRRGGRPLTIVDLSMPRNVDPAARHVPGVSLFDLDDLVERGTISSLRRREEIVGEEIVRYRTWLAGRAVGPLLAQLHRNVHAACRAMMATPATDGRDVVAIDRAAHRVASRLLHRPTVAIKELFAAGDAAAAFELLAAYGVSPTGPRDAAARRAS